MTNKEPELDQSKHPYNVLGEEVWNKLSSDERYRLYFEWVKPQREYWEQKGYKNSPSSEDCNHNWVNGCGITYQGFIESYEYCKTCDLKRK